MMYRDQLYIEKYVTILVDVVLLSLSDQCFSTSNSSFYILITFRAQMALFWD